MTRMSRKIAPMLTKYLDLRLDLVTEEQKEAMRRELRALLAVARAARWFYREESNPMTTGNEARAWASMERALARLDKASATPRGQG